jgi:hypothetical protein
MDSKFRSSRTCTLCDTPRRLAYNAFGLEWGYLLTTDNRTTLQRHCRRPACYISLLAHPQPGGEHFLPAGLSAHPKKTFKQCSDSRLPTRQQLP